MKASLTKAEVAVCLKSLELVSLVDFTAAEIKARASLQSKLTAGPEPKGANAGALETALMQKCNGKVVKLASGSAYGLASKTADRLDATEADMAALSRWVGCQGWLAKGSLTMLDVFRKWHEWLPKAKALNDSQDMGFSSPGKRKPTL